MSSKLAMAWWLEGKLHRRVWLLANGVTCGDCSPVIPPTDMNWVFGSKFML